eukprot:NODE_6279_length_365_cov_63.319620_g5558_i0.p1 GENE.NODE_6279_length_365_cov_63.319620_g5558_i0~~NODE_6279_length_365_cov_63.319620_g5558_i0.p1  ORF type:complete len:103 (+),score=7.58 NODE_6279_length_365_cov_63.319620_g5558_i0:50-358(+)
MNRSTCCHRYGAVAVHVYLLYPTLPEFLIRSELEGIDLPQRAACKIYPPRPADDCVHVRQVFTDGQLWICAELQRLRTHDCSAPHHSLLPPLCTFPNVFVEK